MNLFLGMIRCFAFPVLYREVAKRILHNYGNQEGDIPMLFHNDVPLEVVIQALLTHIFPFRMPSGVSG